MPKWSSSKTIDREPMLSFVSWTPGAVRRAVRRALGLDPPGRAVSVYTDDTFIVSYPKSGNTWVRFLLATLQHPDAEVDFVTVHDMIPDIYRTPSRVLKACARPRILKSHESFDPRYPKVVYLVRDPRDVVTSYFHHRRWRAPEVATPNLDEHLERFLAGGLDCYGNWQQHVTGWLEHVRDRSSLLLMRYEDLARAPAQELHRLVEFIGLEATEAELKRACERCSFEAMRKLERFQAEVAGTLAPIRAQRPFVRSGTVGGWRQELPMPLAARIAEVWRPTMTKLGYDPD
jgi:hypothetical protein